MRVSFKRLFDWRSAASLAFAATVALSFVSTLWQGDLDATHARGAWCLIFGCLYAVGGTIDYSDFRRQTGLIGTAVYLGLQTALVFGIFWTSRLAGETALCVYPLVAASVALLSPLGATLLVVFLYGLVLAVETHFHGTGPLVRWAVSILPAFGFVVLFSHIAMKEKAARARAETLAAEIEKLAVVQERNRLAREIHDSLGHCLTAIHVQLEAAQTIHAATPTEALAAVAKAQALTREALGEVRRSVGSLQRERAQPLVPRLRELSLATGGWGTAVELDIVGEVRALPPEVEHTLFRAAQEGLTNVRKHAGAQNAKVVLNYLDRTRVSVSVSDDGRGARSVSAGQGLTGLRERAAALGGKLQVGDVPSGGFRIEVELPT